MLSVGTTFSGIGAPEQALKNLGIEHEVKWACDIDKAAKETYLANHKCNKWYDDITKIDLNTLEYVDLYVFGFPCQDISSMGNQNLEKGRSILVNYSLDIIDKRLPKYILFENVSALKSKKYEQFFTLIQDRIKINYNFRWKELNSIDYSVPQNRKRIFGLGIRKDIGLPVFPNVSNKVFLSSILETNVSNNYTIADKKYEIAKEHKKRNQLKGNGFGYRYIDKYAHTLLAAFNFPGNYQLIKQKDKNPRFLTPRECARLQGFPDSFAVHPNDAKAYKQFGNTITVTILEEIFKSNLPKCPT